MSKRDRIEGDLFYLKVPGALLAKVGDVSTEGKVIRPGILKISINYHDTSRLNECYKWSDGFNVSPELLDVMKEVPEQTLPGNESGPDKS